MEVFKIVRLFVNKTVVSKGPRRRGNRQNSCTRIARTQRTITMFQKSVRKLSTWISVKHTL